MADQFTTSKSFGAGKFAVPVAEDTDTPDVGAIEVVKPTEDPTPTVKTDEPEGAV